MDLTTLTNEMPDFGSHEEARQWFKEKFEDDFLIRSSDVLGGNKIYFYHIVKDLELYQQYMESFAKPVKREITNMDTFESYSTVEISENGDVKIFI